MGLFGKNKLTIVKIWVKLWLKPTVDVEKWNWLSETMENWKR